MTVRLLADVEALVIAFLRAEPEVTALVGTRIATRSNATRPCIRVQRIGDNEIVSGYFVSSRVQVEAWGERDAEPATQRIAATAHAALLGIGGTGGMRGVYDDGVVTEVQEALGILSSPDPVTSLSRYLFDCRVFHHLPPPEPVPPTPLGDFDLSSVPGQAILGLIVLGGGSSE